MAYPKITEFTLGTDPRDRQHRINANSFQQDAITTFRGWQYAVYYTDSSVHPNGSLVVNIARRPLRGQWMSIRLQDYVNRTDDGHNTISIGISHGDGTIHLSFDHHCNELKYCRSISGLALDPQSAHWASESFEPVTYEQLPGIDSSLLVREVSYPRFVNIEDDLLFSFRIGQAGSGSDVLFKYSSAKQAYDFLGTPLTGSGNSPYANGIDYENGRLHISWCYRGFVEYEGVHDKASTKHMAQAGPNGPENNYDLAYMYSSDGGIHWYNNAGVQIAALNSKSSTTVLPETEGITVFQIPKCSGILNQEGQSADPNGGFHVLNRENASGEERWYVYSRSANGNWRKTMIPGQCPTETGSRGSVCTTNTALYVVLPGNRDTSLTVLWAPIEVSENDVTFETLYRAESGYDGEPLVDQRRLREDHVLSTLTRTSADSEGQRHVVVLDLDI